MKLLSIRIADYHVLHNFSLTLEGTPPDQTYALHLIVGVNGTGKSTLLRALAAIFQYLEKGQTPPFGFEIRYRLTGNVGITTFSNLQDASQPDSFERRSDDLLWVSYGLEENQSLSNQLIPARSIASTELPLSVVTFTTGSEEGWEPDDTEQPDRDDEQQLPPDPADAQFTERLRAWYLRELPGEPVNEALEEGEIITTNRFMFITGQQMPLLTLCGMLNDMKGALLSSSLLSTFSWQRLQKAMKEPRIKLLRGFSLRLRMNWEALLPEDRLFAKALMEAAHHIVQTGSDYLLVFDLIKSRAKQSGEETNTQPEQSGEEIFDDKVAQLIKEKGIIEFFKRLARLARPGGRTDPILRDIDLFLEIEQPGEQESSSQQHGEKPPLHLLRWLSDGEQSFLGRLCLLSLLGESEALILLDEPEVHFNDKWKRQLVFMLNQSLQGQQSHVLMTTHSSITLSDVQNTSIWVLHRDNGYTSDAIPPPVLTLGTDPSDIMVSVFGAENAAGAQGVQYITSAIGAASVDKKTKKKKLEELLTEVGPGYWRFLIRRELHALESKEGQ